MQNFGHLREGVWVAILPLKGVTHPFVRTVPLTFYHFHHGSLPYIIVQ